MDRCRKNQIQSQLVRGMLVWAVVCLMLWLASMAAGCKGSAQSLSGPYWESIPWQANTVTDLAFDLRDDGEFNTFVWPEEVPDSVRDRLTARAISLNANWDGE